MLDIGISPRVIQNVRPKLEDPSSLERRVTLTPSVVTRVEHYKHYVENIFIILIYKNIESKNFLVNQVNVKQMCDLLNSKIFNNLKFRY